VGGLSVLPAIRRELPCHPLIYLADQAHVPYGPRSRDEIIAFSTEIIQFLINQGAGLIVVACNTASAAALQHLRTAFPHIPFVGMVPAVKVAALQTRSKSIGVLATPNTFGGALYHDVVDRFGEGVTILQNTCPGLVEEIEAGHLNGTRTREILMNALLPMLDQHIDQLVLGCTHYPFVTPLIREILDAHLPPGQPQVKMIDAALGVARQTARLAVEHGLACTDNQPANVRYQTSGQAHVLQILLPLLTGENPPVEPLVWQDGKLHFAG
jgi:glutamate racemase